MKFRYIYSDAQVPMAVEDKNPIISTDRYKFIDTYATDVSLLAIDPGTKSMGITICDLRTRRPRMIFEIKRNSLDADSTGFTYNLCKFLDELVERLNVKTCVIEGQFNKFKSANRRLMSSADTIKGVMVEHGIRVITIYPMEWQPDFIRDFIERNRLDIKLNQQNKEVISARCREILPHIGAFGESDANDSFGLACHYFTNFIVYNNMTVPLKMKIDNHVSVYIKCMKIHNETDLIEELDKAKEKFKKEDNGYEREIFNIQFNDQLTVDENMRSVAANTNAICVSRIDPSIKNMEFIYRYRDVLKKLNINSEIIVIYTRFIYDSQLDI